MRRRTVITLLVVTVLVIAAGGFGTYLLREYRASHGPECTVARPSPAAASAIGTVEANDESGTLDLDAVQLQHASTINAVGIAQSVPTRGRAIALAVAWQESSLRNLDHGDRDSLGLFQQRHSQGWGDPEQLMDPVYAAGQFYDHLQQVSGWQDMPLTEAAQAVQRSALPDAYAKWEPDAVTLAVALSGATPMTLSCRKGATASTAAAPKRRPVAGAGDADEPLRLVLAAAQAELTGLTVGSIGDGGRSATVTVALPSMPAARSARVLAAWAVAHATSMDITQVAVAGRQWGDHQWSDGDPALPDGTVTITVAPPIG